MVGSGWAGGAYLINTKGSGKRKKLKMPYIPIGTGLRYDFDPFFTSLNGGARFIIHKDMENLISSILSVSIGWNIYNKAQIEFSGGRGWFSEGHTLPTFSFLGLVVGIPLTKW